MAIIFLGEMLTYYIYLCLMGCYFIIVLWMIFLHPMNTFFKKYLLLFYVYDCFAYLYVSAPHVCSTLEDQK